MLRGRGRRRTGELGKRINDISQYVTGAVFRNNHAFNNSGYGLWTDIDSVYLFIFLF